MDLPHGDGSLGAVSLGGDDVTTPSARVRRAARTVALRCPLTRASLVDPVIGLDGVTYERTAIEAALQATGRSPHSGLAMRTEDLVRDCLTRRRAHATDRRGDDALLCPIAHTPMRDPVVASDGHTYDLASLQRWADRAEPLTSPLTGERITPLVVRHCALRDELAALRNEAAMPLAPADLQVSLQTARVTSLPAPLPRELGVVSGQSRAVAANSEPALVVGGMITDSCELPSQPRMTSGEGAPIDRVTAVFLQHHVNDAATGHQLRRAVRERLAAADVSAHELLP